MTFIEVVEMVKREAKGEATPQEKRWLSAPVNRKTWKAALQAAIDDCVLQFDEWDVRIDRLRGEVRDGLASRESYDKVSEGYEIWRKKAGRYRLGLEQRLLEISLEDEGREPIVDTLVSAIRQHKSEVADSRDVSPIDLRLWSLLDTVDTPLSADTL